MASSSDPGHFFQTSSALSEVERKAKKSKNKKGSPVRLRSKILACAPDPVEDSRIFAAEAGGIVEHVDIESDNVVTTFTGPTAPLTCLAVTKSELVAGCWDKDIYIWNLPASTSSSTRKHDKVLTAGHTDFVKALLRWPGTNLLVSAGADGAIIVWNIATGQKLHTLKDHARGVQVLVADPVDSSADALVFFSGDSNREIRRWRLTRTQAAQIPITGDLGDQGALRAGEDVAPLVVHETSVYALRFDADGELWTASADKTAKCLVRDRGWEPDTELVHPDFVRDVVVDDERGWVVTACRDEEVRVWEKGTGKLFHVLDGHFEEVTGLALLPGGKLVSVSIDGTVRRWSLDRKDLLKAREEAEKEHNGNTVEEEVTTKSMLTEEEERELAELLDDDDD